MARYRKKPVVIEAEQFLGCGAHEQRGRPYPAGVCFCDIDLGPNVGSQHAHIHTLEGPLIVSTGDYIITGVQGERYPCKPDIFEQTYEPADG